MSDIVTSVTAAIDDADKARARVARSRQRQIRSTEERQYLAAIAHTWFRARRPIVTRYVGEDPDAAAIDDGYRCVLSCTDKHATRAIYLRAFKKIKSHLGHLRAKVLTLTNSPVDDKPPDFAQLAADARMREILERRWVECKRCLDAQAHLAATIMMGGLVEALFVARANTLEDKAPLLHAKSAPLDRKTNKVLNLRDWTLAPYIAVGYELGWITQPAKDFANVLRDYRNFVHPEKERSHGFPLQPEDSMMLWEVAKRLVRQLLS